MSSVGTMEIGYGNLMIKINVLTGFSETLTKSGTVFPLVSLEAEDAFVLDTGTKKTITLSFRRRCPDDDVINDRSSDSDLWSNAYWYEQVMGLIDRWQAKTDGCKLRYTPEGENPYIPARIKTGNQGINGYIKSISMEYSSDSNTLLTGKIEFHLGKMLIDAVRPNPTDYIRTDQFSVVLTGSDRSTPYPLLFWDSASGTLGGAIESYTLTGGVEQPFESIEVKIPLKKLRSISEKIEKDIVPGKNYLHVNAVGKCTHMIVTKMKMDDKNKKMTITAYSNATMLQSTKLKRTQSSRAIDFIYEILTQWNYGVNYIVNQTFLYAYDDTSEQFSEVLTFEAGTSVWYILQVCAMQLRCKIFFAENNAYLVDYCMKDEEYTSTSPTLPVTTGLNKGDGRPNDLDLTYDGFFKGCVMDFPSISDVGTDSIINSVTMTKKDGDIVTIRDIESIEEFGVREATSMYVPEVDDPTKFATNLVKYKSEPQNPISFTLKELGTAGSGISWIPTFPVSFRCNSISDDLNGILVSNESVLTDEGKTRDRQPQKLLLSNFERHYPEGTTTYTFGEITPIDLSSSLAQINSNF